MRKAVKIEIGVKKYKNHQIKMYFLCFFLIQIFYREISWNG